MQIIGVITSDWNDKQLSYKTDVQRIIVEFQTHSQSETILKQGRGFRLFAFASGMLVYHIVI